MLIMASELLYPNLQGKTFSTAAWLGRWGSAFDTVKVVSTRLAGAHAGQRQQAPWISASIRIPLSNIYKPIETENETLYPTHHRSVL